MVDIKKKALVLEGGGIRSAYLSGVLLALKEQGIQDFDVVVGTSAGACCGANFIAGTPEKNRQILEDYLTGFDFVKLWNVPTWKNVVDIDFLIDEVCRKRVPLDIPAIIKAKPTLYMAASDFVTGELVYFNSKEHDIFEGLRASCAMPYLYRTGAYYQGRRYIDGGMTASIPIQKALDLGCTEIVVIGTREQGYRKSPTKAPGWLHQVFFPQSKSMAKLFKERHVHYNQSMELIYHPPEGVKVYYIAPKKELPVSRITRDKKRVQQAVLQGYNDGLSFNF